MFRCLTLFLCYVLLSACLLGQESERTGLFIPNQGQIADHSFQFDPSIHFQLDGSGIFLRNNGISYVLTDHSALAGISHRDYDEEYTFTDQTKELEEKTVRTHRIDLEFVGSNSNYKIRAINPSKTKFNYYLPQCPDGITGVPAYQKVVYQEVYDGVDIVFYNTDSGDFKYDIKIAPYANPDQIKLNWVGADSVRLKGSQELIIDNRITPFNESMPLVYQEINGEIRLVEAQYKLEWREENTCQVSFILGDYDPEYALVIDPWVTNYGGGGVDYGLDVETDLDGNVLMSGETSSNMLIAELGFQMTFGGGVGDAFLAKFNEVGERLWATYYGGFAREAGFGVAADSDRNVYMGGITSSETVIAFDGFQDDYGGVSDGYLVKFNADGERIWGTYYGGALQDEGFNIGIDNDDNPYLMGFALSTESIAEGGHQDFFGGFADAFLVKFNPDGDRIWGTYYGGINAEIFHDMECDKFGNVYASGVTTSPDLISTPGVFQEVTAGGQDAFLVKFSPDGSRAWGTYYGTLWVERGDAVACDTLGNIYMAGKITAPTGGATPDAFQTENGGVSDAFLIKFDDSGDRLWSTYIGGAEIDYAFAVDIDQTSNNVVIAGETWSDDFPVSACATQMDLIGELNAYVTQFLPDGSLFCSSYFGNDHEAESVAIIKDCWVYIAGSTDGNVSTPGAHQTESGGFEDAFVGRVHLASCGLTIPDLTTYEQEEEDVTSCDPCNGSATINVIDFCLHPMALKTYVWSNGFEERNTTAITSSIENICPGEYWVEVTINCDQVDTFWFNIESDIAVNADFSFSPVCEGEPIIFTNESTSESGDIIVNEWDFNDGNFSTEINPEHDYASAGTYNVKLLVNNEFGCADSVEKEVNIYPVFNLEESIEICEGDWIVFSSGDSLLAISDTSLSFEFETVYGCDSVLNRTIIVRENYALSNEFYIPEGETFIFPDGTTITVTEDTSYQSVLATEESCDSIITTKIWIIEEPEIFEGFFVAPNVFTPGSGSGVNDYFFFPSEGVESFQCQIVNRWGQQVFHFDHIDDKWDGAHEKTNLPCKSGVYFYSYQVKYENGHVAIGQASVHLIRE